MRPAHEVVEVKDFIFKRKRRIPLGESANVPASTKKAKTLHKAEDRPGDEEDASVQACPRREAETVRIFHHLAMFQQTCTRPGMCIVLEHLQSITVGNLKL